MQSTNKQLKDIVLNPLSKERYQRQIDNKHKINKIDDSVCDLSRSEMDQFVLKGEADYEELGEGCKSLGELILKKLTDGGNNVIFVSLNHSLISLIQ